MTTQLERPHLAEAPRQHRARRPWLVAVRHYVEMLIAMAAGMLLLDPTWKAVGTITGGTEVLGRPDVAAMVMATNMAIGMTIWMRHRGHRWAPVVEMSAAMYVPYLLLLVPYWTGLLDGEAMQTGGHILMLPAMAVAMLVRRHEYTQHHHHTTPPTVQDVTEQSAPRRVLSALARRWPAWLALAVTLDNWVDPSMPAPWILLLWPLLYLGIGAVRKQLRNRRVLAAQIASLVAYVALVLVAGVIDEGLVKYLLAAGWLAHAAWDLAHYYARAVIPRPLAEWCAVVDLVIGISILFLLP